MQYCEEDVVDRYFDKDSNLVQETMNKLHFAIKCCDENIGSFKYFSKDRMSAFYNAVSDGEPVDVRYHGNVESHTLRRDKEFIYYLKNINFGIVRTDLDA